jgi:hypothetical protein
MELFADLVVYEVGQGGLRVCPGNNLVFLLILRLQMQTSRVTLRIFNDNTQIIFPFRPPGASSVPLSVSVFEMAISS